MGNPPGHSSRTDKKGHRDTDLISISVAFLFTLRGVSPPLTKSSPRLTRQRPVDLALE